MLQLALLLLTGCAVGPNYKRPPVTVPDGYRGLAPDAGQQTSASIGDEKWWTVFQDQQLQELIREALAQNYDVRIAAARVLQAQAVVGITRADQFPTIAGGASANNQRFPRTPTTPEFETSPIAVNLSLVWELDFWGKFRRATEAARASLLATEWGQKAVISSLVSNVASAYFQLLELDLEMDISRNALASRKESLRLVEIRAKGGTTSLLDVRQSEQLVYTAAASIPDLERRIEQQENFISILLGKNPAAVVRGKPLVENVVLPTVPLRVAIVSAGPASRYSVSGATISRRQCPDRCGKGSLFSPDHTYRSGRLPEYCSHGLVHWASWFVEFWWSVGSTDFYGRKDPLQRKADGSTERGSRSDLPAVYPAGLPRSFGLAGRIPQESGVPASSRNCSVQRHRMPRGSRMFVTRVGSRVTSKSWTAIRAISMPNWAWRKQNLTNDWLSSNSTMRWVVGGSSREVRDHHARGPSEIVQTPARTDGKDLRGSVRIDHGSHLHVLIQCRRSRS